MIPTVKEMMMMGPEDFSELLRQDHTPEESVELFRRETEAITRRFGIQGPVLAACFTRFWQVVVILPYCAPVVFAPDWSPLIDPRLLKAEPCGTPGWTWVVLNGHPEWSNEEVVAAEMAERRRLDAPAKDKY